MTIKQIVTNLTPSPTFGNRTFAGAIEVSPQLQSLPESTLSALCINNSAFLCSFTTHLPNHPRSMPVWIARKESSSITTRSVFEMYLGDVCGFSSLVLIVLCYSTA